MAVTVHENIILVIHGGHGNAAQGTATTMAMREAMSRVRQTHDYVGVLHDVSALESVGNDYVRAFAALAKEWGDEGIVYVAVIPKTWVRIFAKKASTLGGITTHFFRSMPEAERFLRSKDFGKGLEAMSGRAAAPR